MGLKIITTISIASIAVLVITAFAYNEIYQKRCTDEGGRTTGFFRCTNTFIDFVSEEAKLKYQLQQLEDGKIESSEIQFQSSLRKVVESDQFTLEEKKLAIELYTKNLGTNAPFMENIIYGPQNFEKGERIKFKWIQFGWGHTCPEISIQIHITSTDVPFYEYEKPSLCPMVEEDSAFLYIFTQEDFPPFFCVEWGDYVIRAKNEFGAFVTSHGYFCEGDSIANDVLEK